MGYNIGLTPAEIASLRAYNIGLGAAEFHAMAHAVCAEMGVKYSQVQGVSRMAHISDARALVCLFGHDRGFSTPQIGRWIKKDHTSVLHGIKRAIAICCQQATPVFRTVRLQKPVSGVE
jgi:chromosomal replication initiation ATPase DnaA